MDIVLQVGLSNAVAATLLAVVAFAVDRLFRRPALSHACWLLVVLKLVTPPLVRVPLPWTAAPRPDSPAIAVDGGALAAAPAPPAALPTIQHVADGELAEFESESSADAVSGSTIALAVWLTGALLWWTIAALRIAHFGRLLRQTGTAPPKLRARIRQLAGLIGLRVCPEAVFVPVVVSPLLWAIGRVPRVLIPMGLWNRLSEDARDALLLHELAHLRRRDHWVRRLELIALGLYWWHPIAWWARRELQNAEEQCCDGWVARVLPGVGAAYATALVETVAFLSTARAVVPLGASGGGQARQLKRRVTMILQGTTACPLGKCALGVVLVVGVALLLLAPGEAQPPAAAPIVSEPFAQAQPKLPAKQEAPESLAERNLYRRKLDLERKATETPPAELIEEAKEAVELLQAQLEVKKVLADAAAKAAATARAQVDRIADLRKTGSISEGEFLKVQADAEARMSDARIKAAELREPEVRLKQALRRLAALERGAIPAKVDKDKAELLRLIEMEKKFDALRKELEELRRELRPRLREKGSDPREEIFKSK